MTEVWKSYKGNYSVSNKGNVRNDRNGKIIKARENIRGYLKVNILGGEHLVHRLVAQSFLPPQAKPEVNHKDLNKQNNHISNLEWVTRSQNMIHYYTAIRKRGK